MSDRDISQQAHINTLGRYKILRRIGRGGMGDVWLCEDPRLNRQVAVKTLPVHNQQDQEFALRFEREAQAAAALHHPHILPIHDYGRQLLPNGNMITYIVMPYIGGGSLAQRIVFYEQKRLLMPAPEALDFLSQAADAIDYAHSQQIIHRDIKPGNMLLRDENWLLLADFGIARILTTEDRLTATGPGFGTPEYMAPEQAQGQAELVSDNYSLAVIAYQMFAGRLPFEADTSYAITIQHLTQPPPPPRQLNPDLSLAFEVALLQGLAKQPGERLESARAFVAALQNTLTNATLEATYRKTQLPSTIGRSVRPTDNQDISELETKRADSADPAVSAQSLVTRRRLLIGGGVAALAAGGLGTWVLASTHNIRQTDTNQTPTAGTTLRPGGSALVLTGHDFPADTLAWSPQKHILISMSHQDDWRISWDIDTLIKQPGKTPLYTKRDVASGNSPSLEVWSPDGKYLAVVNNGADSRSQKVSLDLYTPDPKTGIPGYPASVSIPIPTTNTIYGVGWIQNRYLIILEQYSSITNNNTQLLLRMSDITQPHMQWQPAILHDIAGMYITDKNIFTVSPDNSEVAIAVPSGAVIIGQASISGNKTNWQERIAPLQFSTDPLYRPSSLTGVAWSADGNNVVALASDSSRNRLTFWKWRDSSPQPHALQIPEDNANEAFPILIGNPVANDPGFATGGDKGTVYLWKFVEGSLPIKRLDTGGMSVPVTAMAWSPDGQYLAAAFGDTNASILIWKI
jgi:serine/threonine protein kinase